MKVINVDAETIDMLDAAAEMSMAALAARARRVDPDGVITRSYGMSKIKLGEALRQLRRPPPLDWAAFTPSQRRLTVELINAFVTSEDEHVANIIMRKLRASLFRYPGEPEAIPVGSEISDDGLQNEPVADPAKEPESGEDNL